MVKMRQPWIHSPAVDGTFILGVPFFIVAAVFLFPATFTPPDSMTVISWAILVMGVDVSHVYSTLYRTYFDSETHHEHRAFLYLLPFIVFIVSMLLYSLGALVFWRAMAYLAVFHFARQQYGFMRLYARQESSSAASRRLDGLVIYAATFYPVIDWHLAGQKHFNWFMKNDFLYFPHHELRNVFLGLYLCIIGVYTFREILRYAKNRAVNVPRNLLILGTMLSWYVGIVHFNSDLAFTAINVMSHGIPYVALVWIWGNKKYTKASLAPGWSSTIFQPRYVALFIASLLVLAYLEEGFWNAWVWHENEHAPFFRLFHRVLSDLDAHSPWLKIIVPLLSVPQISHYIIDGFIWKMGKDSYNWRDITLPRAQDTGTNPERV